MLLSKCSFLELCLRWTHYATLHILKDLVQFGNAEGIESSLCLTCASLPLHVQYLALRLFQGYLSDLNKEESTGVGRYGAQLYPVVCTVLVVDGMGARAEPRSDSASLRPCLHIICKQLVVNRSTSITVVNSCSAHV